MRWRRSSSCVPFCDELAELGGQMEANQTPVGGLFNTGTVFRRVLQQNG